jgi:hypothetical protein
MKALGAVDAVCLDGGTSAAMYFNGQLIHSPGRRLTNVVEVVRRPVAVPAAAVRGSGFAILVSARWETASRTALSAGEDRNTLQEAGYESAAMLADPIKLRLPKGLHAFFPVDRT